MGPPREVVEISSSSDDEDDDEEEKGPGKWAVSPGALGWIAKLDGALAPVPPKKKDNDDDEDCVVLDGDPHRPVAVAGAKGTSSVDAAAAREVEIVAVKGEIACKDFPHSRHVCSEFPFGTNSHAKHCSMCYCFVCDVPAPCKYWDIGLSNNDHCHATDKEAKWKTLRQAFKCKTLPESYPKKQENVVYPSTPSPRLSRQHPSPPSPRLSRQHPSPPSLRLSRQHPSPPSPRLSRQHPSPPSPRLSRQHPSPPSPRPSRQHPSPPSPRLSRQHPSTPSSRLSRQKEYYEEYTPEHRVEDEEEYFDPDGEATVCVGNLPYSIDSDYLGQLFEYAGIVVFSEIIYDRETGQSCGYGYVTMSTVQEAEDAVKDYHLHELYGRLVTVSMAAASASPSGARAEETPSPCPSASPSSKLYVGNLPWEVDGYELKQLFSEYGEVVHAKVLYNGRGAQRRSRGFGFVTMAMQEGSEDAISVLNKQVWRGRKLRVRFAREEGSR